MACNATQMRAKRFCDRLIRAGKERLKPTPKKSTGFMWPTDLASNQSAVLYELTRRGHVLVHFKNRHGFRRYCALPNPAT